MKLHISNRKKQAYNWLEYAQIDKYLIEYIPYYKGVMLNFESKEKFCSDFFKQYVDEYLSIDYTQIIKQRVTLEDEYAHTIISLHSLEHSCEPEIFLNECFRLLKNQGTLILQVPFQYHAHDLPNDYFRYTSHGIKYLLEKVGFDNIHIQPTGGFYTTLFLKFNNFSRKFIKGSKFRKRLTHLCLRPFWYFSQKLAPYLDNTHRGWSLEAQSFFVVAQKNEKSNLNSIDQKVILSLTSYGERVNRVHLAIQTLLTQTYQADKILLWLSKDEYSLQNIPSELKKLHNKGLIEVNFCEDIKSYKKLIPSLKLYPKDIIITFDDDIYYKPTLVEDLLNEYLKYPNTILCARAHKMLYNNTSIRSYNEWEYCTESFLPSKHIFPTSGAGTLYPPNCLHTEVTREDLFMKLSPTADDVWFKAMSLLVNTPCKVIYQKNKRYSNLNLIENTQDNGLCLTNIDEKCGNNKQIQQVFKYYDLFKDLQK